MTSRVGTGPGGWLLPFVLSATAGAVDVIGFLALGGLFTAHITGNVVVLAVHYLTGGFSRVGPLLSVPVFVVVLGTATLLSDMFGRAGYEPRKALLVLQAGLLAACLALGVVGGPFADANGAMAVLVGMLAVAAMATQNALTKLALPGIPSTAVMTTNTTQLTVDLATLARRRGEPEHLARVRSRAAMTSWSVAGFVVGCVGGATLEPRCGLGALALPVTLAALAVPLGERWSDASASLRP